MTTLKAKVGGVWVPLGVASEPGQNEVAIQADTPASSEVELWYDTDDPGASFPNMPRGFVGSALAPATDQANIAAGTTTDVTGVSVTWIADPSRRYCVHASLYVVQNTAAGYVQAVITDAANLSSGQNALHIQTGIADTIRVESVESGLSGSTTRKLRIRTSAGTITVANASGASLQAFLWVEDIGAAGVSGGGVWTDSLPKGYVGYGAAIANQTGIGSGVPVDVTNATVTFTANPSRIYKVTYGGLVVQTVAGGFINVILADAANVMQSLWAENGTTNQVFVSGTMIKSGISGVTTWKLRAQSGAGTVTVVASGSYPFFVLVEDIGKV